MERGEEEKNAEKIARSNETRRGELALRLAVILAIVANARHCRIWATRKSSR